MNVMDFFRPAGNGNAGNGNNQPNNMNGNPQEGAPNNQPNPQNGPFQDPKGNPNVANVVNNGNGNNQNGNDQPSQNPLDGYAKIFENVRNANADPTKKPVVPKFDLDSKVVSDVAGKLNFMQDINPELMQKAQSGDFQSIMEIMQAVSRNSYRAALEHGSKLTGTFLDHRLQFENDSLGNRVKDHLRSNSIASNPALKHPLVRQEVNRIAEQLSKAPEYADASPEQLQEAALNYFQNVMEAMNPSKTNKTQDIAGEFDWGTDWFGKESTS